MLNHYRMLIYRLFFIVLLLGSQLLVSTAQNMAEEEFVTERILLQTDRPMYVSGEVIWFKVLAFEADGQRLSDFSQVAYLELISREGHPISRVKVLLDRGQGPGALELPDGLPSGNYTLRVYTQAMRNAGVEQFCQHQIIILNPQQPLVRADGAEQTTIFSPKAEHIALAPERQLKVDTKISGEQFGQRELVTIEVITTDAAGKAVSADVSLAVAREAIHRAALFQPNAVQRPQDSSAPPTNVRFRPENRGLQLQGKVVDERTQAGAENIEVVLAFPGKTALVYGTLTSADGSFNFLLPRLYGLRQAVLQIHSQESLPLVIELDDPFHPVAQETPAPFRLDPEWEPLANELLVNAQLKNAYQAFEAAPVYTTSNDFENVPFFGRPDVQYLLDDYTRFPLPEFFFEVVHEVWVKGKYGEERVEVTHTEQELFEELPPLLLVDGVPVFDQSVFLKINNKLIASTEIVVDPFWLNPSNYKGIIQLTSFEGDARCFKLPENAIRRSFLTFLPQREFSRMDHSTAADERLPDFANTLYWNPSIRTDENGKATVQFYTSDATGSFGISAEGVSGHGLMGSGSGQFEVVRGEH